MLARDTGETALAALGSGGARDRLGFRLVVRLLARCLELLRPVRLHLAALAGGFATLGVLFVPLGLLLVDAFWTRVLQGQALTELQAALLMLDPVQFAHPATLDPATRRLVLERIVAVGIAFGVAATPALLALYYYQVWILQRVNQTLRVRLLERIQQLSLRFHAEHRVGDALYRMVQDSAMVTKLIEVLIFVPLWTISRFLFGVVVVAVFDWRMAVVLVCLWPPLLWLGQAWSRPLRVGFRRARETNSDVTARIQEVLSGIAVVKAYGAEAFEQARFESESRAAFDAAFDARSRYAAFTVLSFGITALALVAGGAWGALQVAARIEVPRLELAGFTVWTLGLYNYFKLRMGDGAGSLRILFRTWGRTQDVAIGLDRVFEILDLEPEVRDAPDAIPFAGVSESVRFEDVRFRYQADRAALEGVSFEAPLGTITAVVGPTGAGKSTLLSLLLRLYEPQSGRILVDGTDLRRFRVESLREGIAVALQENLLFGASVRDNIRYAVPHASEAQVRHAARVACADEFVEALPEGYDTLLGERGTKLSTGQRQRLSIARALAKDAPILLLDEPTAALDADTELRVLRNLAEWGRDRLIFLVTHRLSTIRRADQILVLQDGRIAERGTHEELMARGGAYRRLVDHELAGRERPAAEAHA